MSKKESRAECRFCGTRLGALGASKCVHCSEYQTWPFQVLSRIRLSDLALLVSVGVLAWVAMQDLLRGEKAAIDLKVVECADSRISIAVFNSGSQPGILSGLKLAVVGKNVKSASKAKYLFPLIINGKGKPISASLQVDPGKPVLQDYQVTDHMKNTFTNECMLRVVAEKYEESKPQSRKIDKDACACKDVL